MVTKFTKFSLVKGRTFANPASHPHPNYRYGVPQVVTMTTDGAGTAISVNKRTRGMYRFELVLHYYIIFAKQKYK